MIDIENIQRVLLHVGLHCSISFVPSDRGAAHFTEVTFKGQVVTCLHGFAFRATDEPDGIDTSLAEVSLVTKRGRPPLGFIEYLQDFGIAVLVNGKPVHQREGTVFSMEEARRKQGSNPRA